MTVADNPNELVSLERGEIDRRIFSNPEILARHLTDDLRRPWEKPVTEPHRLTPARVRRGFRYVRAKTTLPASAPKPTRPGPGRPPGSTNKQRARRHDVGKHAINGSSKVKSG